MKNRVKGKTFFGRSITWWQNQNEIFKFLLVFIFITCVFSFILEQETTQEVFVFPHLKQVASLCGIVLHGLGTQCDVNEVSINSRNVNIQVIKGCESIYPTAMLWAAILAYPAMWKWKIGGMAGGAFILFLLNIFRVVSMFYIGAYIPSLFDFVHIYAWQALFILFTLAVFLFWTAKASQPRDAVGS